MAVEFRIENKVCIVKVPDNVAGKQANRFDHFLENQIQSGDYEHLLLNFEAVTFLDSRMLGIIAATYKDLADRDKTLTLCSLSDRMNRLFDVSQLNQIIKIHPTEQEALAELT